MENMDRYFEIFNGGPFNKLDKLFDAKLHSEDGVTFQVHRIQLSMKNMYFKAMYCGNFPNSDEVIIKGIDGDTLGLVLYFLYTNNVVLDRQNVMDLWIASDYLLADSLKQVCEDFVLRELDHESCLGVFLTVWNIQGLGLVEECSRYLVIHFQDTILDCLSNSHSSTERTNLDILKDIPFEALKKILASPSLNVPDERMVWDVILTWIGRDFAVKQKYVPELLKCLFAEDVDESLLSEIQEIITHHFNKSDNFQNPLENFSFGVRSPKNLYFVAHHNLSVNNFSLELYITFDDNLDTWRELETNLALYPDFLIQIGYNIYMFDAWENRTMIFNLLDCSRNPMPPLSINRSRYSVVSVLDQIYVLGGATHDGDPENIIERFDPVTNEWHIVSQMNPMILTEVVSLRNCIYAIGDIGLEHNSPMMMQVYNPMTDEWHVAEAPKNFRSDFTAIVYKEKIYVIGGEDHHLRTAEEYDPEEDTWRNLPDLPFGYVLPKAVELKGLLIVHESYAENNRILDRGFSTLPPVFLDTDNEKWVAIDESSPLFKVHLYQFCNINQEHIVKGLVKNSRLSGAEWIPSYLA